MRDRIHQSEEDPVVGILIKEQDVGFRTVCIEPRFNAVIMHQNSVL